MSKGCKELLLLVRHSEKQAAGWDCRQEGSWYGWCWPSLWKLNTITCSIDLVGSACAFAQDALHLLHFILLFGLLLVSKLLLAISSAVIPQFLYYILSFLKHITI